MFYKSRMIAENLKNLRKRIEQTCQKCGRKIDDVQLIAVAKTFSVELIKETIDAGQIDFGENYVQELQEKHKALAERNNTLAFYRPSAIEQGEIYSRICSISFTQLMI